MPIYVSMLRGINVGGHKRVKMEQLRGSFEDLGFEQVRTYIQSGNVVYKTSKTSPSGLSKKIESKILSDFGFPVSVITRTAEELNKALKSNPFLNQKGIDPDKLHVMFLSAVLTPAALEKLAEFTTAPEQSHCLAQEIYFYLPNGMGESMLMKRPIDRALQVVTTTRNWRTVNQLAQMCKDCD